MAFCDFCPCENCQTGNAQFELLHAQTSDGRWICDVCWRYEVCIDGKRADGIRGKGPCEDEDGRPIVDCPHRPKLIGKFFR